MLTASTHNVLSLPDGRRLGYGEFGDADGVPIFYFHGVPSSRISGLQVGVQAAARGGRIIAIDRPGIGLSDPRPGRSLLDWPEDVAAVADALGIERFAVLGYSGGGPYAAACARECPQRLTAVGIVAGLGPLCTPSAARELSWLQRMQHLVVRRAPLATRVGLRLRQSAFFDPDSTVSTYGSGRSDADREALRRPEARALRQEDVAEAFRQGARGPADDLAVLANPWGFELEEIEAAVHLWYGDRDTIIPAWLAQQVVHALPRAHATFLPEAGHLSVIVQVGPLLETLVRLSRPAHASSWERLFIPRWEFVRSADRDFAPAVEAHVSQSHGT